MFEQDYIMRLIHEMVRFALKLIFNIDAKAPTMELLADTEVQTTLETLYDAIDAGDICAAENQLYKMTSIGEMHNLEIGLLFYSYLNEKSDDFLKEHNFSREEVKLGLEDLLARYGLRNLAELFWTDF